MKTEVISFKAEDAGDVKSVMSLGERKHLKTEQKPIQTFPFKSKHKKKEEGDRYPKELPISDAAVKRHDAGIKDFDPEQMRTQLAKKRAEKTKRKYEDRVTATARAEILNEETSGFLETENGNLTRNVTQREIVESVDLASATKHFDLHLEQFGPYHIDYTDNGRHLLLGGKRGHIAAFDWQTKKLHTENNVMEAVRDVKFLHTENMFAVSQKNYLYIYDNVGTELHCLKNFNQVLQLEFLPKHFLLVGSGRNSWLHYLDVSIGQIVVEFPTKQGALDVMCQNPANAIIHTGHSDGTVSLWSPSSKEPLVRMLAHTGVLKGIAVDQSGTYMATTGLDRKCRIWDVRMYRQLHAYTISPLLGRVAISDQKVIACAVGNTVQTFKDMHLGVCSEPYLVHRCSGVISDLKFVPFEDVLGVGHANGFTSLIIPGSGEANVDLIRANPYETKKQRKEREVKQLLEKIPHDMICLDPDEIARVDTESLEKAEEERKKSLLHVNKPAIKFTPRHKMKGKGSALNKARRKEIVTQLRRTERNEEVKAAEKEFFGSGDAKRAREDDGPKHVLDRFKIKR
ncbi:unnamed protein product, partial [Mesorhabditis belari]|uniref:BING4 C-terminal domain-containing protein n=1 Tax=Mesorhabditis belari TaxID=2138241 RepID=A0AAF3FF58_9BILA